jgi:putative ABC transport system permease protein
VVKAIDRKLLRDLARMKAQAVTIALVIACGVASLVAALATWHSLERSADAFYTETRFADVFVGVKRAPEALAPRIAAIPGVALHELRIVKDVTLDLSGVVSVPVGRMISQPRRGEPQLNRLHLKRGRWPSPHRDDEAIVSEGFADAHALEPGSTLRALVNGRYQSLTVAGVALSPEYVFAIRGGDPLPDDRQFGILWVAHDGLAAAFDMEGAFNDAVVALAPGASQGEVIEALDTLLAPYGSLGAYGRDEQLSHRFIADEIRQQETMASTIPPVFLLVAAFLLNVVLARIVATQRGEIAALKALGYSNRAVAWHFLQFVLLVAALGLAIGLGLGAWLGMLMTGNYVHFFRLPAMLFSLPVSVPLIAASVTLVAACAAAIGSVRQVARLRPAEAMRPPAPRAFRRSWIERAGFGRHIGVKARFVIRNVLGRPLRALVTVTGIALAFPVTILGLFWIDAMDYMIAVQFETVDRGDATVSFAEPVDAGVRGVFARLPGVRHAVGMRTVPERLAAGHRDYRTAIVGLDPDASLRRLFDDRLRQVVLPPEGLVLTDRLAERLGVRPGDRLTVSVLEADRRVVDVAVAGTVAEMIGLAAYMDVHALHRLLGEGDVLSSVTIAVDPARADEVYAGMKAYPRVATVGVKTVALQSFTETTMSFVLVFTGILTAFAVVIAIGVVYNNARIALAERTWELASLRVLGLTRAEVSTMLLAELALEVALAVPAGLWLGYRFVRWLVTFHATELFSIPAVVAPRSYAIAALVVIGAAIGSAWIVRLRIDRLDLIAVLKTRE